MRTRVARSTPLMTFTQSIICILIPVVYYGFNRWLDAAYHKPPIVLKMASYEFVANSVSEVNELVDIALPARKP